MIESTEKTASLPMLFLSGQTGKEAKYVHSSKREERWFVFISSGFAFGRECLSPGPLFSDLEKRITGQRRPGAVRWSLRSLHLTALLMVYASDEALKDCFQVARECVIDMLPSRRRPGKTYQGFIKAQKRLSASAKDHLKAHLQACHRTSAGDRWLCHGWTAFGCDGSRVEAPRTAANQKAFGCAGKDKTGPQLMLTTMYHLGTGLPWDWCDGTGTESERDHLRVMLAHLPPGSMIVADAGFTGYELFRAMMQAGFCFLIRVGANVRLLTELGEYEQRAETVWLWPSKKRDQLPLKLRLIRLQRTSDSSNAMYLVTNVFDQDRLSDKTAGRLYERRWGVEVMYRSYKQTLEQRKLRSDAPEQARWELHWGMTALLLLGLVSFGSMVEARMDPTQRSVSEALRIVRHSIRTHRRWRYQGDLRVLLSNACRDRYLRHGSKQAHNWPRKKTQQPPGIPKIRSASVQEKLDAQRLYHAATAA